jgi:hypothetical protein
MSSDPEMPDDDEAARAARIKAAASVGYNSGNPLWSYANKPSGPHESWQPSQLGGRIGRGLFGAPLIGLALGLVVSFVTFSAAPLFVGLLLGLLIWALIASLSKSHAERRAREGTMSRATPDYLILDALRVICLIGACIAPFVGLFAAMETLKGYHVLVGLSSGVSLLLIAAWIGLAIDIAKHAKQAAGELKELRLLLIQQSEARGKAESTKD